MKVNRWKRFGMIVDGTAVGKKAAAVVQGIAEDEDVELVKIVGVGAGSDYRFQLRVMAASEVRVIVVYGSDAPTLVPLFKSADALVSSNFD